MSLAKRFEISSVSVELNNDFMSIFMDRNDIYVCEWKKKWYKQREQLWVTEILVEWMIHCLSIQTNKGFENTSNILTIMVEFL